MRILIAPMNWGLGHASRCVPLVQQLLDEGHEVILGGDGESLTLLRKHFPKLRYTYLAPLNLRYSAGKRQVWAMVKAMPKLLMWAIKDHLMLKALLREEHFDQIISDNRFGLYTPHTIHHTPETIYITHQLHIMLPKGWRWAEKTSARLHARVYAHFDKVWVPDYEDEERSLAGELSHPTQFSISKFQSCIIEYIGPLSRFSRYQPSVISHAPYDIVAVLSGLEPHRTLLEQEIMKRYSGKEERTLIVQGLMNRPNMRIKRGNITLVPYLKDEELVPVLSGAKHIIARSGYSTIMDLNALGLLKYPMSDTPCQIDLIPTPGQPEQEYLARYIAEK
jgi:predicted glycosyltransferase